jgi:excisionase family DNA binding protein
MATTNEQHFLTVRELAAYLRVSRRKAYELVATGEVPSFRVGSSLRIPRAELDAQLSASAHPKGGEPELSER